SRAPAGRAEKPDSFVAPALGSCQSAVPTSFRRPPATALPPSAFTSGPQLSLDGIDHPYQAPRAAVSEHRRRAMTAPPRGRWTARAELMEARASTAPAATTPPVAECKTARPRRHQGNG